MLIPFVFIIVVLTSKITLIIVIIIIIVIFDLPLCLSDFVDKRGSKVKNTSKEDLEKFYSLSDESEEGTFMLHELHYCALNNRDLCSFIVKCTCLPPTYCTVSLVWIFLLSVATNFWFVWCFGKIYQATRELHVLCFWSSFFDMNLQRSLSICWWWTLIFCCE